MSPSCLETMPRPVSAPGPAGLVMYCQDAGSYAYRLKPRTPYASRSLCFTPRFWEQLAFDRRSDGDALLERFATAPQVLNAPHVGAMLQRLDARTADAAATEAAPRRRLPPRPSPASWIPPRPKDRPKPLGAAAKRPVWPATPARCWSATWMRRSHWSPSPAKSAREPLASGGHLQGRARARRGRGAAEPADGARPRASRPAPAPPFVRGGPRRGLSAPDYLRHRLLPRGRLLPRRLAQTAPPLRPRCCGIPSSGLYKREGAPRGSFLSHPSLPSLLGSRSAVLHRTMSAVPAGEPVVARLSRQRCFLGRLPPHDIAFRLRRLHRMRLLPLIRHSSHLLHAMAFSAKAF